MLKVKLAYNEVGKAAGARSWFIEVKHFQHKDWPVKNIVTTDKKARVKDSRPITGALGSPGGPHFYAVSFFYLLQALIPYSDFS